MKTNETGQAVEQTRSRSSQESTRGNPEAPRRRRFLVVLAVTAAFAVAAIGMVAAFAAPSSADDPDDSDAPGTHVQGDSDDSDAQGDHAQDKDSQADHDKATLWAEHAAEELASKALFLETSMAPLLEKEVGALSEDLRSVLSPLVDDGTISQAQLDAVIDAVATSVREKHQAMASCFSELQALDVEALRALKVGDSEPPEECAEVFSEFGEEGFHGELSEDKADFLSR